MNDTRRVSPYQGLVPYGEEDADFFFGRDTEIELITANLIARRFTLLYGPSGVGKSSVLRAGVAHQLRQRARQNLLDGGAPEFAVVVFSSWRDDPVAGLIARVEDEVARTLSSPAHQATDLVAVTPSPLHPVTSRVTQRARVTQRESPSPLLDALTRSAGRAGGDLLIILDQFEEYLLYHGAEDGEGSFAVELPRLLTTTDARVNVLVAIREDALAKLDRFEGRIPNLFKNFLRVEHLEREAARAAIENPLARYNELHANGQAVTIEPSLVEAVLDQVRTGQVILGETGQGVVASAEGDERIETPYLQLVMTRLWAEESAASSGGTLKLATLERLGGAEKIVRTHLDTTMNALPPAEQDVAARIFRYLVTPSGAKIAHTAQDLSEYAGLTPGELAPTLEKLASGEVRILRPVAPPLDQPGSPRYEIFHDVLGAAILDWRARFARQQEKQASEKRLALERSRVRRLRLGLVGLSLLLLAVVALAVLAFTQSQAAARASAEAEQQKGEALTQRDAAQKAQADANAQKNVALSREVAASAIAQLEVDPERAILLAIQSAQIAPTGAAEDALRTTLNDPWRATLIGHTDSVVQGAFSPDGSLIATASNDGTVRVWDAATRRPIVEIPWKPIPPGGLGPGPHGSTLFAFSPDSQLIATADYEGIPRLWQARTGTLVRELVGHTSRVFAVEFDPDGKQLLTTSFDNTARVWDVATGKAVYALSYVLDRRNESLLSARYSPDGKLIVLSFGAFLSTRLVPTPAGYSALQLVDASSGKTIQTFPGLASLESLFSPDGKFVLNFEGASASAVLWTLSGNRLAEFRGPSNVLSSLGFSPDGKTIIAGALDSTTWLWDTLTGKSLGVLGGHADVIKSAVISPRGTQIVTASADQTVRLWYYGPAAVAQYNFELPGVDPSQPRAQFVEELRGHTASVNSAVFSPDGSSLLSVSDDHSARLWNIYQGTPLKSAPSSVVIFSAFSPDGKSVVTASSDGTARVWDTGGGEGVELRGHTSNLTRAVFSPDGTRVATASADGTAQLWDPTTGKSVAELRSDSDGAVNDIAFSPDGKWLAVAQDCAHSQNTTTCAVNPLVYEVATGQVAFQGPAQGRGVATIAFSHDGKSILSYAKNNSATLWDALSGDVLLKLEGKLPGGAPTPGLAALSADSKRILTLSAGDGIPQLWDAGTGKPLIELRGHHGAVTTAAFSPDGASVITGSDDNTARVWNTETGQVLFELKGHIRPITSVAYSPNGKVIVTASGDYTARLWDAATGKLWRVLRDHTRPVRHAAFSPDGKWVVTAGEDATAQLFECQICGSLNDLLTWAQARAARELTCQERQTFLHETLNCSTVSGTP